MFSSLSSIIAVIVEYGSVLLALLRNAIQVIYDWFAWVYRMFQTALMPAISLVIILGGFLLKKSQYMLSAMDKMNVQQTGVIDIATATQNSKVADLAFGGEIFGVATSIANIFIPLDVVIASAATLSSLLVVTVAFRLFKSFIPGLT